MQYSGLIILLVSFWLMQFYLSIRQTKDYNRVIGEMKQYKSGHLGVGIARTKFNFGPGTVMIVVTNEEGIIIDLRKMSGITVFARFKPDKKIIGQSVSSLSLTSFKKTQKRAILEALTFINSERRKGNLNELTFS
ncbi:transcriptional regulator GutM [Carnobacterium pleistocenium]|uniref:transcriptional regulator GutM n=1 Tax=Carnobacterium pleistocenium TaxID=181073 RepID=UPI0005538901|nr:transcriptional regulator GutM [Carnobacterium pleistocenium]